MMKRITLILCFAVFSTGYFAEDASAHEPIFGLGPHTIYQYGYAFGTEFEKGELGWANNMELIYGLTPDWAATIVAPYQFGKNGTTAGFGDMTLRTKYRFFRKDMRGASSQAALHAGIKFPTGDAGKRLGSGATDYFVGASLGYESRRHYFFTGARYHRNSTYRGLDRGDAVRFNLAYGVRPWQLEYLQPDPVFILEVNGTIAGKNRLDKRDVENTGGSVLRFGPGLLFSYRIVMLKAGISIPVLEKLNNNLKKAATEYVLAIEMHLPPLL
jgi:hypothetical protein